MLGSLDAQRIRWLALRVSRNPLLHFVPSPALAAFMDDDGDRLFVRAANRVGKSRHTAKKLVQSMLDRPGIRTRAIAVNFKQAVKVVSRYLADFIPEGMLEDDCRYSVTRGWTHGLIRLRNGSTCQIMSSDQKPIAHAGDSLHIVWIDEVPPPEILDENIARVMDYGGAIWLTATPIGRPVEWLRKLIEADDSVWTEYLVEFSHDNCPWYTAEQCAAWIAEASASFWTYQQRIIGAWEGLAVDRLFTGFDEGSILSEIPDQPYECALAFDHGELSGHEVALLLLWDDEVVIAAGEYVSEGRTSVTTDAQGVLTLLASKGLDLRHVSEVVGDVNSAGKGVARKGAGHTVNELFEEAFFELTGMRVRITTPSKGPGSVDAGHWVINHALMQRRLFTTEATPQLNYCLRHSDGKKNRHLVDALRYGGVPHLDHGADQGFGYLYRNHEPPPAWR